MPRYSWTHALRALHYLWFCLVPSYLFTLPWDGRQLWFWFSSWVLPVLPDTHCALPSSFYAITFTVTHTLQRRAAPHVPHPLLVPGRFPTPSRLPALRCTLMPRTFPHRTTHLLQLHSRVLPYYLGLPRCLHVCAAHYVVPLAFHTTVRWITYHHTHCRFTAFALICSDADAQFTVGCYWFRWIVVIVVG